MKNAIFCSELNGLANSFHSRHNHKHFVVTIVCYWMHIIKHSQAGTFPVSMLVRAPFFPKKFAPTSELLYVLNELVLTNYVGEVLKLTQSCVLTTVGTVLLLLLFIIFAFLITLPFPACLVLWINHRGRACRELWRYNEDQRWCFHWNLPG